MIDFQEVELFWKNQSKEDFKTAEGLFSLGRYAPALFFCHLSLEKLLKSFVVKKTKNHAPYDHNLKKLTSFAEIILTENDLGLLDEINTFNIKGRYGDYKSKFYKMATKKYAEKYINETKRIIKWLKKL
ncbi:MAG: HEPN domain-containing protein [Patescibacteria group bacterium]